MNHRREIDKLMVKEEILKKFFCKLLMKHERIVSKEYKLM